jgi:UDP-2,3-diacylglucosamine hydrolase
MACTRFVSDLHLDASRPATLEQFRGFLASTPPGVEALYILGDLFEHWMGDDAAAPELGPVLDALRELSRRIPVHVQRGNRDFLLGPGFEARTGCRLLPDAVVVPLHGTPTLLMHGDTLCTDDVRYQRYRRVARHPVVHWGLRHLPLRTRLWLAGIMRRASEREVARKPAAIMDVNPRAVAAVMRAHGVTRLIHGHTHRPAVHRFELDGRPAERIVLGDWYTQGSMLECDPEGCRRVQLDASGAPAAAAGNGRARISSRR